MVQHGVQSGDDLFADGDHVVLLGNALAERMQHHGWLEARLQCRLPERGLTFRNLGFSADELGVQQRTQGFGAWEEHLEHCEADAVFAFFGYVESFRGPGGLDAFRADLAAFVDRVRSTAFDAEQPPVLVLFSSVPFELQEDRNLPDAKAENERIAAYNAAIEEIADEQGVRFVDLFAPMLERYGRASTPLTINGIHLTTRGNEVLARVIEVALCGSGDEPDTERLSAVRELVLEKNLLWFNRYRATDGYNVYGGRSTLEYDGVTNSDVLQRELEVLDVLVANLDRHIVAAARGEEATGVDVPEQIPVATNRPGDGPDGAHTFLDGEEALARLTLAEGLSVNLYADEAHFPRLVNPVQMSWDTRGRLWVAVWPTYPHWQPGTAMNDALLILEDDDGDGVADRSRVFADGLHNPTGFEFWNGGVFVANPPDLLFLRDTDGDDVADERVRVLHGLSSADTHHSANSFVLGPDGALYFQEGIFHQTQIETIHGPVRSRDGCAWRFEPRTWRVERYMAYGFLNPHGHVFDRWGQDFITDGTGNTNYYALPATGFLEEPQKHPTYFRFFEQRSRPAAATEILSSSHFPAQSQGNYLIANVIGFQGVFQYELAQDGSGFDANEVEPLLHSTDPRFRPSDIEVGPDGAVYVLDWHNPLIGHMQHHLRDPSRDKAHGRVLRVTCAGRELVEPATIAGRPVPELLELLKSPDDRVRYRTRIELSARPFATVLVAARAWAAGLDEGDLGFEHHRLEALWVQQQHNMLDEGLLTKVLASRDPRARAAGVRVLRALSERDEGALERLAIAIVDEHPRVRLEAVVALSFFGGPGAVEIALIALQGEMDRFLDYALQETVRALEPYWKPSLISQARAWRSDSAHRSPPSFLAGHPTGLAYLLARLSTDELAHVPSSEPLWDEVLARHGLEPAHYVRAATGLSVLRGKHATDTLIEAIERADLSADGHADHLLKGLFTALARFPSSDRSSLRRLSTDGLRSSTRRLATAAGLELETLDEVWNAVAGTPSGLGDLLDAIPLVTDPALKERLFPRVLGLLQDPPLETEEARATAGRFVRVELPGEKRTLTLAEVEIFSNGANIARRGTVTQSTVNWGGTPERAIDGDTSGVFDEGSQMHTIEDRPDPWWEVDLGAELPIDAIVLWNRSEEGGRWASRLDGYVVRVLDAERRTVSIEHGGKAHIERIPIELAGPGLRIQRAALDALTSLGVHESEVIATLIDRFDDPRLRATVVRSARSIPFERWSEESREALASKLLGGVDEANGDITSAELATDTGRELLALAEELAGLVGDEAATALRAVASSRGPLVVVIRPVRDRMLYDRTELTVTAGRPIELVFDNVDIMPHNLLVAERGALAKVGLAAEAMAADPDAWSRSFVPDLPEVLIATRLLQPGESQTLRFDAPTEPGDYPYVCTFPGHWVRMNGTLHVVDAVDAEANAGPVREQESVEATLPARSFVKTWKVSDFRRDLRKLKGVDAERGHRIFEQASCILCHKIAADEGGHTGPDMREIASKNGLSEILTQVFEPSRRIAEGYATEIFVMTDGLVYSGRVLEETADLVLVQDDPFREDGVELPKDEIEERVPSNVSAMPEGLLSTFEKEEILDLVAFIKSLN